MSKAEIWNVIILFTQAAILIGQLILSRKINQQTISREKGYFIIQKKQYTYDKRRGSKVFRPV